MGRASQHAVLPIKWVPHPWGPGHLGPLKASIHAPPSSLHCDMSTGGLWPAGASAGGVGSLPLPVLPPEHQNSLPLDESGTRVTPMHLRWALEAMVGGGLGR